MKTIKASDIKPGMIVIINDEAHLITDAYQDSHTNMRLETSDESIDVGYDEEVQLIMVDTK